MTNIIKPTQEELENIVTKTKLVDPNGKDIHKTGDGAYITNEIIENPQTGLLSLTPNTLAEAPNDNFDKKYRNKKIIGAVAGLVGALIGGKLLTTNAQAGDFYNGCPGPTDTQIDNYTTINGLEMPNQLTVIPKLFTGNINENFPNMLIAIPTSVTADALDVKGLNLGYIKNDIMKNTNGILAAGIFKDANGDYNIFNPQVYATNMQGDLTLDIEANMPINLGDINPKEFDKNLMASFTAGYAINDRLRMGASTTLKPGEKPNYQLIGRFDIAHYNDGKPKCWVEAYKEIHTNNIEIRLAYNPKLFEK